jgi:hypothetical protein
MRAAKHSLAAAVAALAAIFLTEARAVRQIRIQNSVASLAGGAGRGGSISSPLIWLPIPPTAIS